MMTSEEIIEKRFKTSFLGYTPREVDAFISEVSEEFERLWTEVSDLTEKVRGLAGEIDLYKGREDAIIKTMMASQKVCEDMKKNAEKESKIILSEAELNAEKLTSTAQQRLVKIEGEITEMRRQKIRFEEVLRSSLTTHFKLLEISKEEQATS